MSMARKAMLLCGLFALAGCKKGKEPKVTEVDLRPEDKKLVGGGDGEAPPPAPKQLATTTAAGAPAPAGAPVIDVEPLSIGVGADNVGTFTGPPAPESAFVWAETVGEAVAKSPPGSAVVIAAGAETPFPMLEIAAQGAAVAARPELALRAAGAAGETTLRACAPVDKGACFATELAGAAPFRLTLLKGHAATIAAPTGDAPATTLGPLDAASLGQALGTLGAGNSVILRITAGADVTAQEVIDALALGEAAGARKLVFILGTTPPQ